MSKSLLGHQGLVEEPPKPKINVKLKTKPDEYVILSPGITTVIAESKNPDSIIDSIDTGFGPEQYKTIPSCPSPKYFTHLYKENFLSEFVTAEEKKEARDNLGVYSKDESDKLVTTYVETRIEQVVSSIKGDIDLDFVKSRLKSKAEYEIPEELWQQ